MKKELKIYLASPRGFCAGVKRAIEIVEKSISKFGAPNLLIDFSTISIALLTPAQNPLGDAK